MRCIECGAHEATVIFVQGTASTQLIDDRATGELEPTSQEVEPLDGPVEDVASSGKGPTLCEGCARRRYEARCPPGAPSWEAFMRRLP